MDILMSFHKQWTSKIFDGTKTLEFRKIIGKDFKVGDTVYIYETSKNNGCKMVVGHFTIGSIVKIDHSSGCGTYSLLPYYCENIIKDKNMLEVVNSAYNINLPNYKDSLKLSYIFNPDFLESLRDTDDFPCLFTMSKEQLQKYYKGQEETKKLINNCEDWLRNIGYYNDFDETYFNYYLEIKNIVKYKNPLPLTSFKNSQNKPIQRAPQSWCYCYKTE